MLFGFNVQKSIIIFLIFTVLSFVKGNSLNKDSTENNNINKYIDNWHFQIDIADIGEKEQWYSNQCNKNKWTKVKAPNAWDTYDEALWGYEGIGWYYTEIPKGIVEKNKIIRLKFNRIQYYSKVWLNGILIGENIGGFLPFEIDVSNVIYKNNKNSLVIRVDNKPKINWLPASKQIEWVQYGGILQPVEILQTDSIYINDVTISTKQNKNDAIVTSLIKLSNKKTNCCAVNISANIPLYNKRVEKKVTVNCPANSDTSFTFQFEMKQAKLWSPGFPYLYKLNIVLKSSSDIYDKNIYRFGIRNIKTKARQILLNDTPIKIKGVNRYDIFDKRGPILDEQAIRNDLIKIKQTGANTLRVHYPQSPLTLKLLDEIGFLLIEELPLNWWGQNWWDDEKVIQDTSILKQSLITIAKMIKRDKNHPCIIAWSLANESKTDTKVGNYVIEKLIKKTRLLDSTRLITFTVNDEVSKHKAFEDVDFISRNIYHGNDDAHHVEMLDSLVRKPTEDDIRYDCSIYSQKPMIVSEFGSAGIKNVHGDILFSEDHQAEYIKAVWKAIENVKECSGGILWCWSDYYHRKYFNYTYAAFGPYGVLNINKTPKKLFKVLTNLYKKK